MKIMNYISYMPVDQTLMEYMEKEAEKGELRVFYFGKGTEIEEVSGMAQMESKDGFEYFFVFNKEDVAVRIDRVISYNLKPGPAYDEYDWYALQCLTCQAGYDFED